MRLVAYYTNLMLLNSFLGLGAGAAFSDRGEQRITLPIAPLRHQKVELIIDHGPHGSNSADWTYWSTLEFGSTAPLEP